MALSRITAALAGLLPPGGGRGFVWLALDRGARLFVGLLVNMALARGLGPGALGNLAYALTLAALVMPLANLGLERILIREIAAGRVAASTALGSAAPMRLAGALAGWLLAVGIAWGTGGGALAVVMIVVAGNFFVVGDCIDWVMQSRGDFSTCTRLRVAAFFIGAFVKMGLAVAGAGVVAVALAVLGEMMLIAGMQWWVWRAKRSEEDRPRWDGRVAAASLRAAAPLMISEAAIWIFQRGDVLILERGAGIEAVGIYSVAQRLVQAGFFIPGLFVQLFSPVVARAKDDREAAVLVQRAMDGSVLVAYALTAFFAIGARPLIALLFGGAYVEAGMALRILAWSQIFVFIGCMHSLYLVNRGYQRVSPCLAWLTALASLALNFWLTPRYGMAGAAWANVGAYALTTLFGVALFPSSRPLLAINLLALLAPARLAWAGWMRWRRSHG